MAKNTGSRSRKGSVRDRSQAMNPRTSQYTKRDRNTGRYIGAKDTPYKGVAMEPDKRRK